MAYPYEWSDDQNGRERRYDPREEQSRRAAQRHAEQAAGQRAERERERDRARDWDRERDRRQHGDYASGWWGEEAEAQGYDIPGPYGRGSEQNHPRRRDLEAEASRMGHGIERGWRRLSEGVRHAFEEERGPGERDGRRGGGMFGGQDRSSSLFSHDDGLSARPVGAHRGKGPRGYVRGDDRILEAVSDRLSDDGRLDASGIEVMVEEGEVTLNGQVRSREDKRLAEDLAESVSGVKHLQNNLRVRPPQGPAQASASPAGAGGQTATAAPAPVPGARAAPPPSRPH